MTRETRNFIPYVAPFATWILLQTVLPTTALAYAIRSATTLLVLVTTFLLYKPQTSNLKRQTSNHKPLTSVFTGLLGGLLVLALWVLPESLDFYRTWFCWPLGSLPAPSSEPSPYDPAVCGWTLTLAKLVGSAFIIAPVEELFFRSFLYRWLQARDFLSIPLSRFDLSAFLWTVLLFTLEHDRPLAAALCAVVYGILALRFGLLSAIVAHVTTNLLLAVYVIVDAQWAFW